MMLSRYMEYLIQFNLETTAQTHERALKVKERKEKKRRKSVYFQLYIIKIALQKREEKRGFPSPIHTHCRSLCANIGFQMTLANTLVQP